MKLIVFAHLLVAVFAAGDAEVVDQNVGPVNETDYVYNYLRPYSKQFPFYDTGPGVAHECNFWVNST